MQTLAQRLIGLGLTEKQAKMYVASLFLGPASAQKIAEQSGINRPTTYDSLEELAKLGLISRSKNDTKTVFVASGPESLKDWLKRQAEQLQQRSQTLDELLPELQQIKRTDATDAEGAPLVRFVHGKAGVDAIWSYVMRKAKTGDQIFSMANWDEVLKTYPDFLKTNPSFRVSKKLSSRHFYYRSKQALPSDPQLLRETVRLPYPPAADVTLYEDMAVLLSYGKGKKEWTGIIIENKDIVAVLRQLFDLAWNNKSKKD